VARRVDHRWQWFHMPVSCERHLRGFAWSVLSPIWREFAEAEFGHYSPLYTPRSCHSVADDPLIYSSLGRRSPICGAPAPVLLAAGALILSSAGSRIPLLMFTAGRAIRRGAPLLFGLVPVAVERRKPDPRQPAHQTMNPASACWPSGSPVRRRGWRADRLRDALSAGLNLLNRSLPVL